MSDDESYKGEQAWCSELSNATAIESKYNGICRIIKTRRNSLSQSRQGKSWRKEKIEIQTDKKE